LKGTISATSDPAHLPGMVASLSSLPVIGVPIKSTNSLDGWDSILSILQMPAGIPVATVALDASKNAGILAACIIGAFDEKISEKILDFKKTLETGVMEKIDKLKKEGWENNFDL
jgi:5-(carboxyamino)imidazole ribonucleotide mutase